MRRIFLTPLMLAGMASVSQPLQAAESDVVDSSYVLPDGERVLELRIDVPASLDDTWRMFTRAEEFRTWAAPVAHFDVRVGGYFETSYSRSAVIGAPGNIRNEILVLVPLRLVVIRNVQAPPNVPFDVPTFQSLQTAVHFQALGTSQTRVTLQNAGYRADAKFDGVYQHFLAGNRWTLAKLKERFERGPTTWGAAAPAVQPASSASR